jgi:hypothetical protein
MCEFVNVCMNVEIYECVNVCMNVSVSGLDQKCIPGSGPLSLRFVCTEGTEVADET